MFAVVTTAETRPFVRMIIERMFPTLPVLSPARNRARHRGALARRGGLRRAMTGPALIFAVLLLFCRIGACLMIAPGVGDAQIPAQIRLFVALGATLALAPMLLVAGARSARPIPIGMARLIVCELLIGGADRRAGAAVLLGAGDAGLRRRRPCSGLANPFGVEVDPTQPLPPLATLIDAGAPRR